MDGTRFDALVRAAFATSTRRRALAAAVPGLAWLATPVEGTARRKKPKKPVQCTPLLELFCPVPSPRGSCCDALNETCTSCGCCPEGQTTCCIAHNGKACCDAPEHCCGSKCCPSGTKCCFINGKSTCIGETECCPTRGSAGGSSCPSDPKGCCGDGEKCCPEGCRPASADCCSAGGACGDLLCCEAGQTCTVGTYLGQPRAACCIPNPLELGPCDGVCCGTPTGISKCCPGKSNPCTATAVPC